MVLGQQIAEELIKPVPIVELGEALDAGILEVLLDEPLDGLELMPSGGRLLDHVEAHGDVGLQGVLTKQSRAEAVDRVDVGLRERVVVLAPPVVLLAIEAGEPVTHRRPHPLLELRCTALREGDCGDRVGVGVGLLQQLQIPHRERRRLPAPGAGRNGVVPVVGEGGELLGLLQVLEVDHQLPPPAP
nr:hypothetical protein [Salinarchaeum sp. Harcht-Bsk1]